MTMPNMIVRRTAVAQPEISPTECFKMKRRSWLGFCSTKDGPANAVSDCCDLLFSSICKYPYDCTDCSMGGLKCIRVLLDEMIYATILGVKSLGVL